MGELKWAIESSGQKLNDVVSGSSKPHLFREITQLAIALPIGQIVRIPSFLWRLGHWEYFQPWWEVIGTHDWLWPGWVAPARDFASFVHIIAHTRAYDRDLEVEYEDIFPVSRPPPRYFSFTSMERETSGQASPIAQADC